MLFADFLPSICIVKFSFFKLVFLVTNIVLGSLPLIWSSVQGGGKGVYPLTVVYKA